MNTEERQLFSESGKLEEVYRKRLNSLEEMLWQRSDEEILQLSDDKLTEELRKDFILPLVSVDRSRISLLPPKSERIRQKVEEGPAVVEHFVPIVTFTASIPFSGPGYMLYYKPEGLAEIPRCAIQGSQILVAYTVTPEKMDAGEIGKALQEQIDQILTAVEMLNREVENYNERLLHTARRIVQERKELLQTAIRIAEQLPIPLAKKYKQEETAP